MTDEEKKLMHLLEEVRDKDLRSWGMSDPLVAITEDSKGNKIVTLYSMYEYVPATVQVLCAIGDFYGTDKVDVIPGSEYAQGGCESCDYGSRYEFQVIVYTGGK